MFTEDSGLVKIWVRAIQDGRKTLADVPDIANLRAVVEGLIEGE